MATRISLHGDTNATPRVHGIWIRNALARDVWCRTMRGLRYRLPLTNAYTRGEAQPADKPRALVGLREKVRL